MAGQNWRSGVEEWPCSLSKRAFVRAQALNPNGTLVDDFQFVPSERILHVLNVPSPAATASVIIVRTIVDTAAAGMGLM